MPRSHRITCALPSRTMYSAAISSSSIEAAGPRFSSTGLSVLPTSESRLKFCMLRAPIWITSACSSTASTCRGSISSVTIGRPVSSRASTRIASASSPSPLKVGGDVRVRARLGEALDDVLDLLGGRVRAHHDQELGGSRHGHGTQDTFGRAMRIFSGIQPSGDPHIGNYSGGFRQYAQTQERGEA